MLRAILLCLIIPMIFARAQYREVGLFLGGTNYIGEVGKRILLNPRSKHPRQLFFTKAIFLRVLLFVLNLV